MAAAYPHPPDTPISIRSTPMTPAFSIEQGKVSPDEKHEKQEPEPTTLDYTTTLQKMVAELVGTYMLVFAGCASLMIDKSVYPITLIGIALVWGTTVMVVVYAIGHISGAHINPAVTIALATTRQFPWKQVPTYALSQLLGSMLAVLTLDMLLHNRVGISATVSGFSHPTTPVQALVMEFIITFFLMLVICGSVTDHRAVSQLAGVAIGAVIVANALIAGPISGASMNPARSIAPAILSGKFQQVWVYIVGPTLGATSAALLYCFIRVPKPPPTKSYD